MPVHVIAAAPPERVETDGMDGNTVHTPVTGHGMVYVSAGMQKKNAMAIRLERAAGEDPIAWCYDRGMAFDGKLMITSPGRRDVA